jgi:hypothetical protein
MTRCLVFAALVATSAGAFAQGYFDFSELPGLDSEPKVQIDLNPGMLNFVKAATEAADPNSAEIINGIQGVRVRVYDIGENENEVREFIDDATEVLEREDWERMVYVEDEDAKVRGYVKFAGDNMEGMTWMVAGRDGEAVFINIAGEVNPSALGQIAHNLGFADILTGVSRDIGADVDTDTE